MSYNVSTFTRIDKNANGTASLVLTYTGNAGELPVEYAYPFDNPSGVTADYMRAIAMQRIAALNANLNFVAGALPNVGAVLDTTTPLPTPAASTFGQFMAASAPYTPGATPQDVFSITGSATRVVQVQRMSITTVQTTAGLNAWQLVKRSTANTGGTSTAVARVPTDDSYPAATATVLQYTGNPTLGTLIGAIWSGRVAAPVPASAPSGDFEVKVPDTLNGRFVTLTGITDVLAWNLGGIVLPAGLSVQACVWWTEV